MSKEEENEQVSWNLSQIIIVEIGNNLRIASDLYYQRRFFDCFMKLKSVGMRVNPYLSVDEIGNLKTIEDSIFKKNSKTKRVGFGKPTGEAAQAFGSIRIKVDEYNNKLLSLLKKYGLLIATKEDKTKIRA